MESVSFVCKQLKKYLHVFSVSLVTFFFLKKRKASGMGACVQRIPIAIGIARPTPPSVQLNAVLFTIILCSVFYHYHFSKR